MAEYVLYADLNLPQSTRPRIPTVPDVQDSDCTYAEVKVKSQDTNAAADCKSSGKSCCSRKHAAILVVIILILVLAVYLIITYGPTAGSQNSSTTLSHIREEELGCPPLWRKHGRKCYFFSPEKKMKDWEASRGECTTMESDLVVIDSREEMVRLLGQPLRGGSCLAKGSAVTFVSAPVTCPWAMGRAASHGHPSPGSGSKALHRERSPGAWSPAPGSFCAQA
uniref:C-type lectin domain family 5 member A-like n=1 Tax=Cyanistes caeruleus TaxID=156563 RepID=A0A8C0TUW9_CYACU